MRKRERKNGILYLLLIVMSVIFITLVLVEEVYLGVYQEMLAENVNLLNESQANKVYGDLNDMWYRTNLLSATLSRCDAMRDYLYSEDDSREVQLRKFVVYLTQVTDSSVDSVVVTDLRDRTLFVYGARDERVIEDVGTAIGNGLRVTNPTHLQIEGENGLSLYCVNRTETRQDSVALYTIIAYNIDKLYAEFEEMASGEHGVNLILLDGDNRVIMASPAQHDQSRAAALSAVNAGRIPEGARFYQTRSFSLLRWRLVTFVVEDALESKMTALRLFAAIVAGAVMVLLMIFFVVLNKQINEPIRQIVGFMRRQAEGLSAEKLEISNKNELEQIAQGLNEMLKTQREMTQENIRNRERVFEIELAQKEAEISALTHQINPHFLYNTLDCMRGMALAGGMDDLEQVISALACVFRYATRGGAFVKLRDEIGSITSYMEIIRIRHNGRIDVRYILEEEALRCEIPKMILQPVVENAILYGMERISRRGTIEIRAWTRGEELMLRVRDEGKGMAPEALSELRQSLRRMDSNTVESGGSIGLRNIQRRLQLLYGASYGLTVESEPERGTEVTIRMRRAVTEEQDV